MAEIDRSAVLFSTLKRGLPLWNQWGIIKAKQATRFAKWVVAPAFIVRGGELDSQGLYFLFRDMFNTQGY